jgi:hypothetical protein
LNLDRLPTLALYRDGVESARFDDVRPIEELRTILDRTLTLM